MMLSSIMTAGAGRSRRVALSGITPEQDWINRSTAAGVTYSQDFRTDAIVTNGKYRNGVTQGNISQITNVYRDASDGISGTGGYCLRIDHPANVGDDPGAWMCTMNPSWTTKTQGMGTTRFYIQYRLKIPTSRITLTANGGGWKNMNLATYDPQNYYNGSLSNVLFEHVLQDVEYRGVPHAYRRDAATNYTGFETLFGGANFRLQNALDNGCATAAKELEAKAHADELARGRVDDVRHRDAHLDLWRDDW